MPATPKPRQPLSRERIARTAIALVDAEGLDALTMRRLGAELGMDPMSVYYYLPNKAALLDAVVEAVMSEIDLSVDDPSAEPEERLMRAAGEYAAVLVRHRNALPLLLVRGPATPEALAPVEFLVGILRSGGVPAEHTVAAMHMLTSAVRGYAAIIANEAANPGERDAETLAALASPGRFPYLCEAAAHPRQNTQAAFEFGLRAIVAGLLGVRSAKRLRGGPALGMPQRRRGRS
jgi:TetR/AcrR family transcriptional regulator, tetracycline repressor protein